MIHPVIFFQQHTFFIVYILLYNTILNWFLLTLQSLNIAFFRMLNIFFTELNLLYTFIALIKKKITRTSMISVFLFRKKNYNKIKVYCKQNLHFYWDFF
jgi:hypothetical protein